VNASPQGMSRRRFLERITHATTAAAVGCTLAGCQPAAKNQVVVYAALDREFSEPELKRFEKEAGIDVLAKYDAESTKTVGLANAIIDEAARPRCDVFWNNEILNTLRLERRGLLEAHRPPGADKLPAMFKSAKGTWHGFATRARVLLVNTKLVPREKRPSSIRDLAAKEWKGRAGIAKPLFGTTATHATVLFAHWGPQRAKTYFRRLKENDVQIAAGNKQVAIDVARGKLAFGLTDTDDAIIELDRQGADPHVAIVFPDQAEGEMGTLLIPNTLALIKGGPNAAAGRRLIDWLLSPEVEDRLARGRSAQLPVMQGAAARSRAAPPDDIRWMEVDFERAADQWDAAARSLRDEFTAP